MAEDIPIVTAWQSSPKVEFGGNTFQNVPVLLKFDETPLVFVTQEMGVGYWIEAGIYSSSGDYLAKARGSRLFLTKDGEKAGLKLRHPQGATVCELAGKPVFEIIRTGDSAARVQAELHTPTGIFIRSVPDDILSTYRIDAKGGRIQVQGTTIKGNIIVGAKCGFQITSNGCINMGGG